MKNLRIHPEYQRRGFAHFLIKQVEAENRNCDAILCDSRANQNSINSLLKFSGYGPLLKISLYDENNQDIVFIKTFNNYSGIMNKSKKLFA